ncbi:uncharacterized protein LOC113373725 [Ctenocephalides felis]|uniref:uncharacterized protein LOC113373725 n=1 Tax=Ctenocephalides felis TaxID=7515 RepID=UPI000E6E2B28|nr:uncharacterized protein LOC113373725 [Ctenocephalides felis]
MAIQTFIKKEFVSNVFNYMVHTLSAISSHGIIHIVKPGRHPSENIIWFITCIFSVWMTMHVAKHFWSRLEERPTITSVERDRFEWNTTFPTITLCPHWNVNQTAMEIFARQYSINNTSGLQNFLRKLIQFDNRKHFDIPEYDELPSHLYLEALKQIISDVKAPATTGEGIVLRKSRVSGTVGICYAFNSEIAHKLDKRNIDIDLPDIMKVHALDNDAFAQILEMEAGYDIYAHSPYEIAAKNGAIKCPVLNSCFLQFKAISLVCAEGVKNYLLNNGNAEGEKICNVSGMRCLYNNAARLHDITQNTLCLPNCENTYYTFHSVQRVSWFQGSNLRWELQSSPRVRFKRNVIFDKGDMLGSTIGLFLGCSMLTLVEIVFYGTLQIIWRAKCKFQYT